MAGFKEFCLPSYLDFFLSTGVLSRDVTCEKLMQLIGRGLGTEYRLKGSGYLFHLSTGDQTSESEEGYFQLMLLP